MPGPNTGRTFFACSSRGSAGNASLPSRCNFFRWDIGDENVGALFKQPVREATRPSSDNHVNLSDASKAHFALEVKTMPERRQEAKIQSPIVDNQVLATLNEKLDTNAERREVAVSLQRNQYFGNVALYNNGTSFHNVVNNSI
jgi:hypothetical protein